MQRLKYFLIANVLIMCFGATLTWAVIPKRSTPSPAADPNADLVKASLLADVEAAAPGSSFQLGVLLKMKEHWHTYWINPGETGNATEIRPTGPAGFTFGKTIWPIPSKFAAPGGISYGYGDEVLLMVPVTVGKDVKPGVDAEIRVDVSWLCCKENCIEGDAKLTLTLPIQPDSKPANRELFDTWQKRLPVPEGKSAVVEKVEQPASNGIPLPSLIVNWKQEPKKVEWFPISTNAVAIEDVAVKQEGPRTTISFKPNVFKPDQIPDNQVGGVLVYEDAQGLRHGVSVSARVPKGK